MQADKGDEVCEKQERDTGEGLYLLSESAFMCAYSIPKPLRNTAHG